MFNLFEEQEKDSSGKVTRGRFVELKVTCDADIPHKLKELKEMLDNTDFSYPFPEFRVETQILKDLKIDSYYIRSYMDDLAKHKVSYTTKHPEKNSENSWDRDDKSITLFVWEFNSLDGAATISDKLKERERRLA